MKLQPILTPCKGAGIDLILSVDPASPDHLHLFWGTALLQIVPRDRNSLLFRVTAGLLTGLGLKMSSLEECFGTTGKTLRKWGEALRNGDWDALADIFHGPGAEKKLRSDVERYVRVRYREALDESPGATVPYGFRDELVADVMRFWEIAVCGEVLRRVFRDEDARRVGLARSGAEPPGDITADSPGQLREHDEPAGERPSECREGRIPAETEADRQCEREEGCAFTPAAASNPSETRNVAPESAASDSGHTSCDPTSWSGSGRKACSAPLLSDSCPGDPAISQHAGLFLLNPWFEKAFGSAPDIIRQTAAQILLGAVNQEQSKHIDYAGLGLLTACPVRDIDYQHRLLGEQLNERTLMEVFDRNAELLDLRGQRIFYVDPHHKHYTGMEKTLLAWSGKHHDTLKGVLMDFIHTQFGAPCFIGHFDNYYDARERFLLLVGRFRELFAEDATGFVWINDRGYWSHEFLRWIAESGDNYIQWEKGYKDDGWSLSFLRQGKFTIVRRRNNRTDRIKIRVRWREQTWDKFPGARRLIVRIRRPDTAEIEVSIVTNHASMSAERPIGLMLGRWLQENDFTYLGRHFGIDELGGRKFDSYAEIADELEDRGVESREHKRADAQRRSLRTELGKELVKLHGMPPISLEQLDKDRERIRRKATELSVDLERLERSDGTGRVMNKAIDRLGARIGKLSEKLKLNRGETQKAEQRAEIEAEAAGLQEELNRLEARIREMNRTESRLVALIEEEYVRPDLRKKALIDAVRITCRNVFREAFDVFRPIYDDYRDDHAVLRQLSRSSGILIKHPDRIDIYLTPALHRQPAQWGRIHRFTDICTHRVRRSSGVELRFLLGRTDQQIFAAVARARPIRT